MRGLWFLAYVLSRGTCFQTSLHHSLSSTEADRTLTFNEIVERIHSIFSEPPPPVSIHICGNFNIHPKECLVHSNKTEQEGRYSRDFFIDYEQTQIFICPLVFSIQQDITQTSWTSSHCTLKNDPLKCYLHWLLQAIHCSVLSWCQNKDIPWCAVS